MGDGKGSGSMYMMKILNSRYYASLAAPKGGQGLTLGAG